MKKNRKLSIKLFFVLLLMPLFPVSTINATSGRLQKDSIVKIGGTYYGKHGSDNHWHVAKNTNNGWYASGPEIGKLEDIEKPNINQTGWQRKGNTWYYNNSRGVAHTGWTKVGSSWYYMSGSGAMQTGWTRVGSSWYYMSGSGAMQTGWTKVGSSWYYMSGSGVMQTGWTKVGSSWYYMTSSGAMQTGWTKVGSTWYYMSGSGAMQTGWTKIGSTWYYISGSGAMQTGWTKVGSAWYYMTGSGAMQTGWSKINGSWYYLSNSGAMNNQTGWNKIGKNWYYQSASGSMDTGWKKIGSNWYYMKENAIMQTGWTKVGTTWYYMSGSGAMQTGWEKLGTNWYYMNSSGAMQTGQVNIGGIVYYFNSSGVLEKEILDAPTDVPDKAPDAIENMTDAIIVNGNVPWFTNDDLSSTEVYHLNGKIDALGRVTAANAVVGVEIMPSEDRGSISHHIPTGWIQRKYTNVDSGGWLYNRSHLIGYQMTGNNNFNNLMTGTRWFNMRMVEYENWLANYVEQTENHVRYRITPIFEGNNLVASGIYMEGFSIEDIGEGVMFNVFVPNIQPGVEIDYTDGSSVGPEGPVTYEQLMNSYDSEEEALKDIFSISPFV